MPLTIKFGNGYFYYCYFILILKTGVEEEYEIYYLGIYLKVYFGLIKLFCKV